MSPNTNPGQEVLAGPVIHEPGEDDYRLIVGSLPGRKKKAIGVECGTTIYPVAYFRDESAFQEFKQACKDATRFYWEDVD